MKKIKIALTAFFCLYMDLLFAAGDPFDKATGKAEELLDFLTGKFAIALISIVIAIAGYMAINGSISKRRAYEIIGGSILIYGATTIGAWLMS